MTKRISIIAIATTIFLSVMIPQTVFGAEGGILGDLFDAVVGAPMEIAEKVFSWVSLQIGFLISYIAAFAIALLVSFIQILIDLSKSLTSTDIVQVGFKFTLAFANLGFVLAIIVIAFATILRIQSYAMKQLLWKLVVAALLVNFSFAIVGTIVDFTNILSNYFLTKASPGQDITKFGDNLANSLNVNKISLFEVDESKRLTGVLKFGGSYIQAFTSIAVTAIFSIFLVLVFAAVAFMMLVRHIAMILLLILMPLAWLFWIFPGLSKHWSDWWSNFLKWAFFLPAMTFFIFLSVSTFDAINKAINKSSSPLVDNFTATASFGIFDTSSILVILQIIVQGALLLGGIMVAQKMGITGANAFMNAAKGSANWIKGTAWRATGVPAAGRGLLRPTKAGAGWLATKLSQSGLLRAIPGVKSATAGLAKFSSRKTEVEEYQKNYLADLTKDQFEQVAKTSPVGPVAKAAILAEATKRGKVSDITAGLTKEQTEARLELFAKAADATNPALKKDLLAAYPNYAAKFGKEIEEVVKGIRADKASEINKDSLLDKKVAMLLSESQISNIYRNGSTEQKDNLKKALEEAAGLTDEATKEQLDEFNKEVENTLRDITRAKQEGDKAKVKALQTQLKDVRHLIETSIAPKDTEQREAFDKLQTLKQRIANTNIT